MGTMRYDKPRDMVHQPRFPELGVLQQPPLAGWGWTNGGKLLPRFLHRDQRMLPDTWMHSEELWTSQTSSSGHPSKCLQQHLQQPKH